MSASKSPTFPQPLSKDLSLVLPALWGLRIAVNHEKSLMDISDPRLANTAWLSLVGDFVVWPPELLCTFMQAGKEEGEIIPSRRRRRKKIRSSIRWNAAFEHFSEVWATQPERLMRCFGSSIEHIEAHWLAIREQDTVWKNVQLLTDLLKLSPLDQMIVFYLLCVNDNRGFREFLNELEFISIPKSAKILSVMFECADIDFLDAVHPKQTLMANGLISRRRDFPDWNDFIELSDCVKAALILPNKDLAELMNHFTAQTKPGQLNADDMLHMRDNLKLLTNVIKNALVSREHGVNILLYGAPGTGKTEFAKLLANQVGASLYEVGYTDRDGEAANERERYVSLLMAQNFLSARSDTLLLFDEVEDVLESSGSVGTLNVQRNNTSAYRFSKAWVNEQLESNPVPIIWVCNEHRLIDPAHLRRFLFNIEFRVPPRSVRQRIVERYFKDFNLPESALQKLSFNATISPAQLEITARLLKLSGSNDPHEMQSLLNESIKNSMQIMGQKDIRLPKQSITPYRLDYLNIDSKVSIPKMLLALQKRGKSSLCFYGPPGTGKTQLAEYIAEDLDKQLVIKKASDLLSKWLGESEQNIAEMFEEAADENAILFLDEADSFLRERQGLTKSWEVSQVNELLQHMERFDGLFICATNLFEQLDQAALRRFAFKICFDYLNPQQRLNLFAESLNMDLPIITGDHQKRLLKLDNLTPGDFATVLRQASALGEEYFADDFLLQLENECSLKNGGRIQRSIGFI